MAAFLSGGPLDSQTPIPLTYQPRVSNRRYVFLGIWISLALAGVLIGSHYLRSLPARLKLQWDYFRCERYVLAPSQVVYDASQSSGSLLFPQFKGQAPFKPFPKPQCWLNLEGAQPLYATFWSMGPPLADGPMLFLHQLRSPNGTTRLVMLELEFPGNPVPAAKCHVFDGPTTESTKDARPAHVDTFNEFERFVPQKIFAGQLDPADSSHFTIAYETKSGRGIIDGYLQDDGLVTLDVRDGPAHLMHDTMAAIRQHPEEIKNHLALLDLSWSRAFWKLPQEYDDFVYANWHTRKGKLWRALIATQWRYWRRIIGPDRRTDEPGSEWYGLERYFQPADIEPPSNTDGPLDRLTPDEIRLAQRLMEDRKYEPFAGDCSYPRPSIARFLFLDCLRINHRLWEHFDLVVQLASYVLKNLQRSPDL